MALQVDKGGVGDPGGASSSSDTPDLKIIDADAPDPEQGLKPDLVPSARDASATGLARTTVPDPTHPNWDEEVQTTGTVLLTPQRRPSRTASSLAHLCISPK